MLTNSVLSARSPPTLTPMETGYRDVNDPNWADHARFHLAGPDPRSRRAFFIAGFRTSTLPLKPIAIALNRELGLTIDAITLPGHESDRTFRRYGSFRYVREVRNEFLRIAGEAGEPIIIGGFSTGATIALILAARYPELVRGVVLASPALHLANRRHTLMLWLGYILWLAMGLYVGCAVFAFFAGAFGYYFLPDFAQAVQPILRNKVVLWPLGMGLGFATLALFFLSRLEVDFGESERIAIGDEMILGPFYRNVRFLVAASLVILFHGARIMARVVMRRGKYVFVATGDQDDLLDVNLTVQPFEGYPHVEVRRYTARHAVMNASGFESDLVRKIGEMLTA